MTISNVRSICDGITAWNRTEETKEITFSTLIPRKPWNRTEENKEITFSTLNPRKPRPHVGRFVYSRSLVAYAPNASQELPPYESTSALILMRDRLCVLCARKLSSDNTICHGTKTYIRQRKAKGSFAAGICRLVYLGAVAADLLVQMLWADTSDQTLGKSVSNRFWTRKRPKGIKYGSRNKSRCELLQRQALCNLIILHPCLSSFLPRCCGNIQLLLVLI
jgi:hypothetical protein